MNIVSITLLNTNFISPPRPHPKPQQPPNNPLHADLQKFPQEPSETLPNGRKMYRTTRKYYKIWDESNIANWNIQITRKNINLMTKINEDKSTWSTTKNIIKCRENFNNIKSRYFAEKNEKKIKTNNHEEPKILQNA